MIITPTPGHPGSVQQQISWGPNVTSQKAEKNNGKLIRIGALATSIEI
jgi:hypothetical protein